jgi:AraC family transcriptional regulator of adaptative response/methylated-DNA-[protein]-cysteine methyltransferase
MQEYLPEPSSVYSEELYASLIDTPLGRMITIASDDALYLMEFVERKNLYREIKVLQKNACANMVEGRTKITDQIEGEIKAYFAGTLTAFKTPYELFGTDFQKSVWNALRTIPHGQTWSYAQLAENLGNPKAFRAVAKANSTNQLAVLVPCHRVINKDGGLGGYAGGLERKEELLQLEKKAA